MTGSGATPSGQETCDAYECTRLGTVRGWYDNGVGGEDCLYCDHHAAQVASTGEFHPHTLPTPAQEAPIDSSLIAAHDATAGQTPAQEAGSGRHVQSAARNLTPTPGMSSELDGGRQAAVEAVARWLADRYGEHPVRDIGPWQKDAAELLAEVAALSQPGEPT